MITNEAFFNLLFKPEERTCFGAHKKVIKVGDFHPSLMTVVYTGFQFFVINPLKLARLDENVTAYRNILVEFDEIPLDQQKDYIKFLELPYSTQVYSGGKSMHFLICLEDDLPDEQAYRALVKRIYSALDKAAKNDAFKVDSNCANPSRFSRVPGHLRGDKGKYQRLIDVRSRVPNANLEEWLIKMGCPVEIVVAKPSNRGISSWTLGIDVKVVRVLNGFTKNFIMFGADEGERNISLFRAACNCRDSGLPIEEATETLKPVFDKLGHDFSWNEFQATINSAYSRGAE